MEKWEGRREVCGGGVVRHWGKQIPFDGLDVFHVYESAIGSLCVKGLREKNKYWGGNTAVIHLERRYELKSLLLLDRRKIRSNLETSI